MLQMRQSDYDDIRRHGEETYPHECCGILLGRFADGDLRVVHTTVRCENLAEDSRRAYTIDLRHVIRIQREARQQALDIVGFYHSHPDHPAAASPRDLQDACWTGCSYVITAVENGTSAVTASHVLRGYEDADKILELEQIIIQ